MAHTLSLPLRLRRSLFRRWGGIGKVFTKAVCTVAAADFHSARRALSEEEHREIDTAYEYLETVMNSDDFVTLLQAVEILVQDQPPAPLLVGIELNPGPPKNAIASFGQMLGSAVANLQKTKKTKKKKKTNKSAKNDLTGVRRTLSLVNAPVTSGYVSRNSSLKHKPVIISGRGLCAAIATDTSNNPSLAGSSGTKFGTSSAVTINVDAAGGGSTSADFKLFPPQVYALSSVFLRWRLRKLVLSYVPACPTSTAGLLVMATVSEVTSVSAPSNLSLSYVENAVSGPVWTGVSFDAMKNGLRTEWLFCDTALSGAQSSLRQETAGAFSLGLFNQAASTQYGQLWADYELEFEELALNADYTVRRNLSPLPSPSDEAPSSCPSASSSFSPSQSSTFVSQHEISHSENLGDSIYISADMLNRMRLPKPL
jgi:hypothetical protein